MALPPQEEVNEDFFSRSRLEWGELGGHPWLKASRPADVIVERCGRLDPDIRHDDSWLGKLATRGDRYVGDERNVILAFRHAPELAGLVRFNVFSHQIELNQPPPWCASRTGLWTDDDDTAALGWLQTRGVDVRQRHVVRDVVSMIAKDYMYHPVRNYLHGLVWDGAPRLRIWLAEYLNAEAADPLYLGAVGQKFLLSAVARIENPGCQADHVLVLEGPQGAGKSSVARTLAVNSMWFTDDMPDIHSKDAAIQVCGRWIVELAELAALRRSEIEGMKAFLTRPRDVYRPPYGRSTIEVPRQCVFIATTNEAHYLRDSSGNRRFWPVRCGQIDLGGLHRDRDQLWAEALAAYRAGTIWHLTQEEAALAAREQSARVLVTELEVIVREYLAGKEAAGIREIDTGTVMSEALHMEREKPEFAERAGRLGSQVAAAMEAAVWRKVGVVGRGSHRSNLYRKDHGATAAHGSRPSNS